MEQEKYCFVAPPLEQGEGLTTFYALSRDGFWPFRTLTAAASLPKEDWEALESGAAALLSHVRWRQPPRWSRLVLPQEPAGLADAHRAFAARWAAKVAPIERFLGAAADEYVARDVKYFTCPHIPVGEGREARGLIAAFTSWHDVARGRFIAMRAERYFARFFGLSPHVAAQVATSYRLWAGGGSPRRLVITRRIDVVDTLYRATVYNEGGGVSCMCGSDWKTARHPACAYVPADSDWHIEAALPLSDDDARTIKVRLDDLVDDALAVAFVCAGTLGDPLAPETVLARSVVYPGCGRHVRPYGRTADDRAEIADALERVGLTRDDDLEGAVLYLHWEGERAPMPYLDGCARYVIVGRGADKPAFALASSDGDALGAVETSTDGFVRNQRRARCECCGEIVGEHDLADVAVGPGGETQRWCEPCRESYARSLDYSVENPAGGAPDYIDADRARDVVGRGGWHIVVPDWEPIETFRDCATELDVATLWWDCERGWIIDDFGAREGNIAVLRDFGTPLASVRWPTVEFGRAPNGRLWVARPPGLPGEKIRRALASVTAGGDSVA